jgi:hypothetical protein
MILALALVSALAGLPLPLDHKPAPAPPAQKPATPAPQKPAPPTTKPSPATRPGPQQENPFGVRGFVHFGGITFAARETFDTIFGSPGGFVFGGGGQVLLPWGLYAEVGASRFSRSDGERVFVGPGDEVFRLGIPVEITMTPLEITGGWRYRPRQRVGPRRPAGRPAQPRPTVAPAAARGPLARWAVYGGAGLTSVGYKEQSNFAGSGDNVDERFSGFHVVGGGEYLPFPWMAIGGEVLWSSVSDALGQGGVSKAFGEDDLGGTTLRVKISIGR